MTRSRSRSGSRRTAESFIDKIASRVRGRREQAQLVASLASEQLERAGVLTRFACGVEALSRERVDTPAVPRIQLCPDALQTHPFRAPARYVAQQRHLVVRIEALAALAAADRAEQTLRFASAHWKGKRARPGAASLLLPGITLVSNGRSRGSRFAAPDAVWAPFQGRGGVGLPGDMRRGAPLPSATLKAGLWRRSRPCLGSDAK